MNRERERDAFAGRQIPLGHCVFLDSCRYLIINCLYNAIHVRYGSMVVVWAYSLKPQFLMITFVSSVEATYTFSQQVTMGKLVCCTICCLLTQP